VKTWTRPSGRWKVNVLAGEILTISDSHWIRRLPVRLRAKLEPMSGYDFGIVTVCLAGVASLLLKREE